MRPVVGCEFADHEISVPGWSASRGALEVLWRCPGGSLVILWLLITGHPIAVLSLRHRSNYIVATQFILRM
jgi:hypothetical protein